MNKEELKKFLNENLPIIDEDIPDINCGGCGVFANMLCEQLDGIKIPYVIYAVYFDNNNYLCDHKTPLIEFVKTNTHPEKAGEDHIVVYIPELRLYFDSTGEFDMYEVKTKIELTKKQLDVLVKKGRWNSDFDRDFVPKMKKDIEDTFSKIRDSTNKTTHKHEKINGKNPTKKKAIAV